MNESAALARCEEITKQEAKNFYFGIRLLPKPKRMALSALYALAREMDDIADGDEPAEKRQASLDALRKQVHSIGSVSTPTQDFGDNPSLWGVYYSAQRYPIPLNALDDLLNGCEQDISGKQYKTFDDMEAYCRMVAGSVGRLSLGVFGADDLEGGFRLADDLGVALQITNILRDILEDKNMGRVYLPLEDLKEFGLEADFSGSDEAREKFVSFQAERALEWYKKGFELLNHLDRRSFACTAAMAGIYFGLLKKIRKEPSLVFQGRLSLSRSEKMLVVARSLLKLKP